MKVSKKKHYVYKNAAFECSYTNLGSGDLRYVLARHESKPAFGCPVFGLNYIFNKHLVCQNDKELEQYLRPLHPSNLLTVTRLGNVLVIVFPVASAWIHVRSRKLAKFLNVKPGSFVADKFEKYSDDILRRILAGVVRKYHFQIALHNAWPTPFQVMTGEGKQVEPKNFTVVKALHNGEAMGWSEEHQRFINQITSPILEMVAVTGSLKNV